MTNLYSLFSIILGVRGRRRTHRSSTKVRTYAISNLTASVDENLKKYLLISSIVRTYLWNYSTKRFSFFESYECGIVI